VRRLLPFLNREICLLEVGSGSGAFLNAVNPYVGKAIGIEPDIDSRKWIEREFHLQVLAQMDDALATGKRFDIVVLFHVLEHVIDPVKFLHDLSQLLLLNGKLIIEVPNVDDILLSVYEIPAYQRFYYQKAHLYYFSKATLTQTLEDSGFISNIQGIQRYDLSNHICWMLTGKPGGQDYYSNILLPSVNATYGDALISSGRSDTLWAIAQLIRI
jgi:SAM-dependent methyltransferase